MEADVARWCLTAGIEWKPEEIKTRTEAISAVASTLNTRATVDVVRLVFGKKPRSDQDLNEFIRVLREKDPTIRRSTRRLVDQRG